MNDTAAGQMLNLHFTGGTFCQYNIRIGPVNRVPEESANIITKGMVFGSAYPPSPQDRSSRR
jgi:hypothetical protein